MTLRLDKIDIAIAVAIVLLLVADNVHLPDLIPDVITDDAPIEVDSPHLLLVYQFENVDELTPGVRDVVESLKFETDFRQWVDSAGYTFRAYDPDSSDEYGDQWVKDAVAVYEREQPGLPWCLIANDTSGYLGPIPEGVEAMQALLEEYR